MAHISRPTKPGKPSTHTEPQPESSGHKTSWKATVRAQILEALAGDAERDDS